MRADGVKGAIAHNLGKNDTIASVTIDRKMNGSDLSLKAAYQLRGDVFTLQASGGMLRANAWLATVMLAPWAWLPADELLFRDDLHDLSHRSAAQPPEAPVLLQETWKFDKANKLVGM